MARCSFARTWGAARTRLTGAQSLGNNSTQHPMKTSKNLIRTIAFALVALALSVAMPACSKTDTTEKKKDEHKEGDGHKH